MKLDGKTGCYRSSLSIQNSECLDKKCMETGKQGFGTQAGGTGKDGPMAISKSKVLDTIANQVTSEVYIGDSEPGFGFIHGVANKKDTVIGSQNENESFPSCKTKFLESELYTEKTITEVSSKLIACYKSGSCYVIKDICVDDGKQSEEKHLIENHDTNEKLSTGLTQVDIDAEDELSTKLVGKITPLVKCGIDSNSTLEKDKVLNYVDSGNGTPKDGDLEELFDAAGHSNDSTIPSNQVEGHVATAPVNVANEKDLEGKTEHSQSKKSAKDEQFLQFSSKIGNKSITFTFDPSMPPPSFNNCGNEEEEKAAAAAASGRQPEHHHVHSLAELCLQERRSSDEPTSSMGSSCHVPEELNGMQGRNPSSDPGEVSEKLQPGVRSMSASITFSGPVQYSGSISLRSDSSTASTHSFAFPVLPAEWNGSPVRMAKADSRQFRKHRGWRMSLLCCRF
ncbi:uncharacterized protein LOC116251363 isoform X1 [Nymphaea colorata]|nr:uncharacterized protein LOC116251363 isoform X1 [Nymphaea colorata]XP_031481440.1 uncharacterized protein LOC116251363 isoform X1 [Nymphaea colorata]XP_049933092.1 uncharacterized protein LOC116251363 isoform X1 [Nymphaea colorata]